MKPVQVYECEFCGKYFKTPNRHKCKFDPKLKNCFTCRFCKGWDKHQPIDYIDVGIGMIPVDNPNTPDCKSWKPNPISQDIESIKDKGYDMQCPSWEQGEYWSDTHVYEDLPF